MNSEEWGKNFHSRLKFHWKNGVLTAVVGVWSLSWVLMSWQEEVSILYWSVHRVLVDISWVGYRLCVFFGRLSKKSLPSEESRVWVPLSSSSSCQNLAIGGASFSSNGSTFHCRGSVFCMRKPRPFCGVDASVSNGRMWRTILTYFVASNEMGSKSLFLYSRIIAVWLTHSWDIISLVFAVI